MQPIGLDLDGSVVMQRELAGRLAVVEDLRELGDGLRLMSLSRARVEILKQKIVDLRRQRPGPWLTFLGSGDFHYVVELLLATLPAEARPFSLVLIDNHPDWFSNPPRYHCGNWLARALAMQGLESVAMIGQDSPDLKWFKTATAPFKWLASGRVRFYPQKVTHLAFPLRWMRRPGAHVPIEPHDWGTRLHFQTLEREGAAAIFKQVADNFAGRKVYVSIDKDVLAEEFGASDWERGRLTRNELTAGIQQLREKCDIIGADVCGESAPEATRGLIKRIDSGRIFGRTGGGEAAANEPTNLEILRAFLNVAS